jgi:hypothetical protein
MPDKQPLVDRDGPKQVPGENNDKMKQSLVWVILVLAMLLLFGGIGYWFWTQSQVVVDDTSGQVVGDAEDTEDEDQATGSSITGIDSTWDLYTNHDFGFSIKIPKEFYAWAGECAYSTENEDHSYRPFYAEVPMVAFEDEHSVFLTNEYFYELGGETTSGGISYYSECNRITNSLELTRDDPQIAINSWKINITEVNNEQELETYIKDEFGTGCELGEQTETEQAGVYAVSIDGSDLGAETPLCPIDSLKVLRYYPSERKLVDWDAGNGLSFPICEPEAQCEESDYGPEMIESFRFI